MKRESVLLIASCVFVSTWGLAGNLTIEGNLNVTSNLEAQLLSAPFASVTNLAVTGDASFAGPVVLDENNAHTNRLGGWLTILGLRVQQGWDCKALGYASHAEGSSSWAIGNMSHAEGESTSAYGPASHTEGSGSVAPGWASHAEGLGTAASGDLSHAEGDGAVALGWASHAEGCSTVAEGDCSHAGGQSAFATNHNSFVWSDGTPFGSTVPFQFSAYARNGFRFHGGPISGDGSGLTNLTAAQVGAYTTNETASLIQQSISEYITEASVQTNHVGNVSIGGVLSAVLFTGDGSGITNLNPSVAVPANSITADKLALESVGTNSAVVAEWNAWADARYLRLSGNADLVLQTPGRIVAGIGQNLSNMEVGAFGAMQLGENYGVQSIGDGSSGAAQFGYNDGVRSIGVWAIGSSQHGYNWGVQTIGDTALGAMQSGYNLGLQAIGNDSYGSSQQGWNDGTQTIHSAACGAFQQGYNWGDQSISGDSSGASQRGVNFGTQRILGTAPGASQIGYNQGVQSIGLYSHGAVQQGFNSGEQTIADNAVGASQMGVNEGKQSVGPLAFGAEQRGHVAVGCVATNSGKGSIQLLNLMSNQAALVTGHASIGLGACVVTNDQALVAGDGLASHGRGTITAAGFYGCGAGLVNLDLSAYAGANITWDTLNKKLNAAPGYSDSNAVVAVINAWTNNALSAEQARSSLGLGNIATHNIGEFAPVDLSPYQSDSVVYSNGHFHAAVQLTPADVTNAVLAAWQNIDTDKTDDLSATGATMSGVLNMNTNRIARVADPQEDTDAVSKKFLKTVLSCIRPQGDLSMGSYTNNAPDTFPLD